MVVRCEQPGCGRVYDDAKQWTICPHNPLEAGSSSGYCGVHDFFWPCPVCQVIARGWGISGKFEVPE
jgi:hypothetical protein